MKKLLPLLLALCLPLSACAAPAAVPLPGDSVTAVPDTYAGSATCLYDSLRRAVCEMGVPLESAVRAATENPARSIGVDADYGSLAAGRYGNVVLADDDLNILAVVQKGKVIHDNR